MDGLRQSRTDMQDHRMGSPDPSTLLRGDITGLGASPYVPRMRCLLIVMFKPKTRGVSLVQRDLIP